MEINNHNKIGVIGSGSFGLAVTKILSINNNVLLFSRKTKEITKELIAQRIDSQTSDKVEITNDIEYFCQECQVIFPIIPSDNFKQMLTDFNGNLTPKHILIHGTKGFHIDTELEDISELQKTDVLTISELILKYTNVVRVGCISGPNLAKEIFENKLAATVVASKYDQVIEIGKSLLNNKNFKVYGSYEIKGVELAGVMKNYIAIASGIVNELGYGLNTRSWLITRGMMEMMHFGKKFGAKKSAFIGLAGIGDLITTCNSPLSRNYRVGKDIAKGINIDDSIKSIGEVAEGIKTVKIIKFLDNIDKNKNAPIAYVLYNIIYENWEVNRAINFLLNLKINKDYDI